MPKVVYLKDRSPEAKKRHRQRLLRNIVLLIVVSVVMVWVLWPGGYRVTVDGKVVGVIADKNLVDSSLDIVISQLEHTYNTSVRLDGADDMEVRYAKMTSGNKITSNYLVTYLRNNMGFTLEFRELTVDGHLVGIIESEIILEQLLAVLSNRYYGAEDLAEFTSEFELRPVYAKESDLVSLAELTGIATVTTKAEIEYEIKSGDTLSGIAAKLGISMARLLSANPGMTETTPIIIGRTLNAEVDVPFIKFQRKDVE